MKLKQILMAGVVCTLALGSTYSSLDSAHEAYVKGDLNAMARHLRDTLAQNPPDSVRKNALELLRGAYAKYPDRKIETDWKLPAEIRQLKIAQRRVQGGDDRIHFGMKIAGNIRTKDVIKQIQLVKYPNEVVLDKNASLGEWSQQIEDDPKDGIYFELDGPSREVPAVEGLYLIHIELANGNKVDGWAILADFLSSKSPVIRVPASHEGFATGNPTFQFDDFHSPEFVDNEFRSAWMAVTKMEPPHYKWNEVWKLYTRDLPKTKLVVGKEEGGVGVTALAPGNYRFYVAFKEEHRFGEVRVGRQSAASVPFQIK